MVVHDGVSYEYAELSGYAYVHIDGHLYATGPRREVMWTMFDLPLVALLELSLKEFT